MKRILMLSIKCLIVLIYLLILGVLTYYIHKLNIIPNKYLIVGYGSISIVTIIAFVILFRSIELVPRILSAVIIFIMTILFSIGIYYLNHTYHFLRGTQVDYDTLSYNVIVLKDKYNKISELKNKNITYLNDDYKLEIKENINKKIVFNEIITSDLSKLIDMLNKGETDAIVLEESYVNLAKEEIEGFSNNTKIIYTFRVRVKAHKEESNVNVIKDPFIIYISGIDQYGSVNSVRGRSDVNQLLVINPNTHHILIVNTPRDYYVHLHGTSGLRDKLTHAGIYGIEKSISTMEDIYGIDIDHYIRINFDTLIKVVDVIGGLDIYSDKAFVPWTNNKVYVNAGWNHFNGVQALAYARERKTYVDGDHHRGRNQQQIIEAIIDKLTSTSTLLNKYNSILNSLDGSFQTDMDTSMITSFIKYQLDKMPKWTVESIQSDGYASWNYTYSMGYNYYLWVMEPNWNSVNINKNKIQEVLNEREGE